ncbi:hypothetical protein ATANTOWER_001817, partial [Ataeniobius toweri]|nr:hypothetical protein [Ataeniobius toweri]
RVSLWQCTAGAERMVKNILSSFGMLCQMRPVKLWQSLYNVKTGGNLDGREEGKPNSTLYKANQDWLIITTHRRALRLNKGKGIELTRAVFFHFRPSFLYSV